MINFTKVADAYPPPHAKYMAQRKGYIVTATPCYGMHSPWWVVMTMEGEVEPVNMETTDLWIPLKEIVV